MKKLLDLLSKIISTFFFVGYLPLAPGTFGSIAALTIVMAIFYQPYNFHIADGLLNFEVGGYYINPDYLVYILIIMAALSYIIGAWAAERYSKLIKNPDPKKIVIDEVAGIFTAAALTVAIYAIIFHYFVTFSLYLTLALWYFVTIFFLFRFFDIVKPWHIGWSDKKVKGGHGIMLDDQIAALYSVIVFYIGFFALYFTGVLDSMISVE
ncbi:MAG TPA: hypothetical protein DIV86_02965 [Alphaproteobacteria bacterium]|nr:hypothetical protein [Alphaproteobacteria bacterium]